MASPELKSSAIPRDRSATAPFGLLGDQTSRLPFSGFAALVQQTESGAAGNQALRWKAPCALIGEEDHKARRPAARVLVLI